MHGVLANKLVIVMLFHSASLQQKVKGKTAIVTETLSMQIQPNVRLILGENGERQNVLSPTLAVNTTSTAGLVRVNQRNNKQAVRVVMLKVHQFAPSLAVIGRAGVIRLSVNRHRNVVRVS